MARPTALLIPCNAAKCGFEHEEREEKEEEERKRKKKKKKEEEEEEEEEEEKDDDNDAEIAKFIVVGSATHLSKGASGNLNALGEMALGVARGLALQLSVTREKQTKKKN